MEQLKIPLIAGEHWWGGCIDDGRRMPFGAEDFARELRPNLSYNQASPILLSDKGRHVWKEDGFAFSFSGDCLEITYDGDAPILTDGCGTLREAYRDAAARYFPADGGMPAPGMFDAPQYSTWINTFYEPTQERVITLAREIRENGYKPGVLIIDCGWSDYYGRWNFNRERFPQPREMVEQLHEWGFAVMLWVIPFVTADTVEYRYCRDHGLLIRQDAYTPAIRAWWDGFSAVLDFTNPDTREYFAGQLGFLQREYGIDGFKLDAGDAMYYTDADITYAPVTANGQSELWGEAGLPYRYNEYRSCWCCGGKGLAQRLRDKLHAWGENGLAEIVPCALAMGLGGYPFSCPDMIGGGEYLNFTAHRDRLDPELFVRYAQAAALMPMMQFSAAPWRVLPEYEASLCQQAAALHTAFADRITALAEQAAATGEPIIRYMEYQFPGQGLADVTDQFMLGDDLLVAPVLEKGAVTRTVRFPAGRWQAPDGTVYGEGTHTVPAPLDTLPYFRRTEA